MLPAVFEPIIPASEQTHALDSAATGIGSQGLKADRVV